MLMRNLILTILFLSWPSFSQEKVQPTSNSSTASTEKLDDQFIGRAPSKLTWAYGTGSSESQNFNLDSDLPFFFESRLSLGLGGTWGKSETGYVQTNSTRVGIATDPFSTLGANIGYDRWGQSSVIETDTFRAGVSVSPDWILISIDGEYRTISWLAQELGSGPEKIYAYSRGIGGRIAVPVFKSLRIGVSGMSYGYNDMPESFDDLAIVGFITEPSLNQTAGFLQWYAQGDISYFFDEWRIMGKYDRSVSKLDDAIFNTYSLKGDYSPFLGWSFGLLASRSQEQEFENTASYYGELSVGYSWQ